MRLSGKSDFAAIGTKDKPVSFAAVIENTNAVTNGKGLRQVLKASFEPAKYIPLRNIMPAFALSATRLLDSSAPEIQT